MQAFRGGTCGCGFGARGLGLRSACVLNEEPRYSEIFRRKAALRRDRVGPPSGQKSHDVLFCIFVVAFVYFSVVFFPVATVRFSPDGCACVAGVQESNLPRCHPPSAARKAGPQDLPLPQDPPTPPTHLCTLFGAARPVCVTTKLGPLPLMWQHWLGGDPGCWAGALREAKARGLK